VLKAYDVSSGMRKEKQRKCLYFFFVKAKDLVLSMT